MRGILLGVYVCLQEGRVGGAAKKDFCASSCRKKNARRSAAAVGVECFFSLLLHVAWLGVWRCVTGMGRGKSVSVSSTLDNLAPNLLLTHTHSRLSDAEQPLAHTPASRAHAQHAGTPSATYASLIRHLIRNTRIRLPVARMLSHQAPVKALLRLC